MIIYYKKSDRIRWNAASELSCIDEIDDLFHNLNAWYPEQNGESRRRYVRTLEIHYEGQTEFVATDQQVQALAAICHLSGGLGSWCRCARFDQFVPFLFPQWTLADPFVEGGEGVVVLGHGLARDWTDMTRGGDGPAGGGLVGRPINELYLSTIQVTKSLSAGARLVFPLAWCHRRTRI